MGTNAHKKPALRGWSVYYCAFPSKLCKLREIFTDESDDDGLCSGHQASKLEV